MARKGDWFLSSKGNRLYPLDLRAEDIDIEEIAHSLSNICRFGGHCKQFYSVAQHSVIVAWAVSPHNKLSAILHDATEAYCGDMVRPLKMMMPIYREMEANIWDVICNRFGIDHKLDNEIDEADARVLLAEKRDLLVNHEHVWDFSQCKYPDLDPFPLDPIQPWKPNKAKKEFLRFYEKYSL